MAPNQPEPLNVEETLVRLLNENLAEASDKPQATHVPAYRGSFNGENLTKRQKKAKLAKRRAVKKSRSINRR